jgi:hypothetical protein
MDDESCNWERASKFINWNIIWQIRISKPIHFFTKELEEGNRNGTYPALPILRIPKKNHPQNCINLPLQRFVPIYGNNTFCILLVKQNKSFSSSKEFGQLEIALVIIYWANMTNICIVFMFRGRPYLSWVLQKMVCSNWLKMAQRTIRRLNSSEVSRETLPCPFLLNKFVKENSKKIK